MALCSALVGTHVGGSTVALTARPGKHSCGRLHHYLTSVCVLEVAGHRVDDACVLEVLQLLSKATTPPEVPLFKPQFVYHARRRLHHALASALHYGPVSNHTDGAPACETGLAWTLQVGEDAGWGEAVLIGIHGDGHSVAKFGVGKDSRGEGGGVRIHGDGVPVAGLVEDVTESSVAGSGCSPLPMHRRDAMVGWWRRGEGLTGVREGRMLGGEVQGELAVVDGGCGGADECGWMPCLALGRGASTRTRARKQRSSRHNSVTPGWEKAEEDDRWT